MTELPGNNGLEENLLAQYKLVRVPAYFTVRPLVSTLEDQREIEISSNHNILKGFAAILQICYGSFELYQGRGAQIAKFGYAAYSLTVIPYILMSLINLIASLCRPDYSTLYMVYYRGEEEEQEGRAETTQPGPSTTATDQHGISETKIDTTNGTYQTRYPEEWMRVVENNSSGVVGYAFGVPEQPWISLSNDFKV